MPNEKLSQLLAERPVGPPALLGLRPRFMEHAVDVAQEDERIRALSVWGSLARGDADDWSDVDFVVTIADDSISAFIDELCEKDNDYGESLVTLRMPQDGVAGGGFVSVTYLQSGFPMHVDWYVCPLSLGLPVRDTKPIFTREARPSVGPSFAELLRDHPSQESETPSEWDLVVATIPTQVKGIARGHPELIEVDGEPAKDRIAACEALGWTIAKLPDEYADARPALFNYLGVARLLR